MKREYLTKNMLIYMYLLKKQGNKNGYDCLLYTLSTLWGIKHEALQNKCIDVISGDDSFDFAIKAAKEIQRMRWRLDKRRQRHDKF